MISGREIQKRALAELDAVGIEPRLEHGGKHIRLFWEHKGEARSYTLPMTPSDNRSAKNNIAGLRRILRSDGLLGLLGQDEEVEIENALVKQDAPRLSLENGVVMADSLDVAIHFGKSHKDVLRSIDRLIGELDAIFTERNFTPSVYLDSTGKSNRCYKLSQDALSLLAMGFTGKQAIKWKQAYIEAFNKMEAELMQIAAPQAAIQAKLNALESDIAALTDLVAEYQTQALLPAPKATKPKLKPIPRWMRRQYDRKMRRTAA